MLVQSAAHANADSSRLPLERSSDIFDDVLNESLRGACRLQVAGDYRTRILRPSEKSTPASDVGQFFWDDWF